MTVTIPMELPSIANLRLHWRAMDRLKKQQKQAVAVAMHGTAIPVLPVVVTLTRIGLRRLDSDNLASAFKYVRDSVAACYGVDDGDERYTWVYQQRTGKAYSIEIEIKPL